MKRMVAFTESSSNQSYVEPSPYAWLRTRAPVPTTYAPACDPLYPFQEILENRTSRARGTTGSCTEVSERKFLICIEIWQFELESCVWRVSFHKYAYVYGDPVNAIDPTGWFSSTQVVVTVGIGASSMSQGASSILALLFLYSTIGPSVESLQELMAIQELAQKLKTEVVRKTDIEKNYGEVGTNYLFMVLRQKDGRMLWDLT